MRNSSSSSSKPIAKFFLALCFAIVAHTPIQAQTRRPQCFAEITEWKNLHQGTNLVIGAHVSVDGEDGVPRKIYVKFGGQIFSSEWNNVMPLDLITTSIVPIGATFVNVYFTQRDVSQVLSLAPGKVDCFVE